MFNWRVCALWLLGCGLAACNSVAKPTYPERRAGRGDPCLVLNDCKEPLLCLGGRCLDAAAPVEATGKQCVLAECIDDSDCCPPLSTLQQTECTTWLETCGEDEFCWQRYTQECTCGSTCVNNWCAATSQGLFCTVDDDCLGDWCVEGRCMQCREDVQCGAEHICEAGRCELGCLRDEACGALERCEAGRCVARGCLSTRECIGLTGQRDAECREGECIVPCEDQDVCAGLSPLSACLDGVCRSLGCESHTDCALISDLPPGYLLLCLDPSLADAARRTGVQLGSGFFSFGER